jgi:hypothetical protein
MTSEHATRFDWLPQCGTTLPGGGLSVLTRESDGGPESTADYNKLDPNAPGPFFQRKSGRKLISSARTSKPQERSK